MARPVDADAEATKARILKAALALVAERGIDGSSIRDIAAGARVSLATVLHYFGSKDRLYEACVDAMYTELDALRDTLFAAVASAGSSVDDVIVEIVRAAFKFTRAHRPAHRILLRTVIDEGGMRADRRERYLKPFLDDVSAALAPLLRQDATHVRLSAQSVVHLVVRYLLHSPEELRVITGAKSDAAATAIVESHIVDVARSLLLHKPKS